MNVYVLYMNVHVNVLLSFVMNKHGHVCTVYMVIPVHALRTHSVH